MNHYEKLQKQHLFEARLSEIERDTEYPQKLARQIAHKAGQQPLKLLPRRLYFGYKAAAIAAVVTAALMLSANYMFFDAENKNTDNGVQALYNDTIYMSSEFAESNYRVLETAFIDRLK